MLATGLASTFASHSPVQPGSRLVKCTDCLLLSGSVFSAYNWALQGSLLSADKYFLHNIYRAAKVFTAARERRLWLFTGLIHLVAFFFFSCFKRWKWVSSGKHSWKIKYNVIPQIKGSKLGKHFIELSLNRMCSQYLPMTLITCDLFTVWKQFPKASRWRRLTFGTETQFATDRCITGATNHDRCISVNSNQETFCKTM